MSVFVSLPSCTNTNSLHFGSQSNYQRFRFSYFNEETKSNKHIITDIKYHPDDLYSTYDGMTGNCWLVEVNDSVNEIINTYYIRNWSDIVHFYKEKKFNFVNLGNDI